MAKDLFNAIHTKVDGMSHLFMYGPYLVLVVLLLRAVHEHKHVQARK